MVYYYLMYQKEWMELNTGQWYASGKNISIDFTDFSRHFWNKDTNQITLTLNHSFVTINIPGTPDAFSSVHEAAHANFYYSNLSREGSKDKTHRECGYGTICCVSEDGCFRAISEGQSDFNTFMLYPDVPIEHSIEGLVNREVLKERGEEIQSLLFEEVQSLFFGNSRTCLISRDHRANKNLTAQQAFNCEPKKNKKGDIHNMGALYASIWWEIYNRKDTSKKDIATLFTEHLPLVSNNDTLKSVAFKIINKARDLFNGLKGEHYACIISQEFTRRGLTPLVRAVE